MAKKKKRSTPFDRQGTKAAGKGSTKPKKSMARTYSTKSTKRTSSKKSTKR